ncbi:MAG: hypothetical protein QOF85_2119 [Solirubrobacterales bacterium]|jgi:hypothetical protein|nr:hypothetical protein [Solirubrobacterales bacterium]
MAAVQSGAQAANTQEPVLRTFARGWLTKAPQFGRLRDGAAVCRLLVVGEALGPASKPPKVSLYVKGAEAERCADGLLVGDLIEGVGIIGPERERADRQEVLLDEGARVILRARPATTA